MTGSHRKGCAVAVTVLLVGLAWTADADHHGEPPIQMISANVQGKNIYIPGTIVVVAGKPRTLSTYNTTDTPHGFSIEGVGVETVLLPQVEHPVEVPALKVGLYRIFCQLHPPHRSAQLLVVDAPE